MIGTKIEYEVDNYSGLIEVSELINEVETPKPHWTTNKKKHYIVPPSKSGVYILFGETATPIYIGKANNLRQRLLQHLRYSARGTSTFELCWHRAKQVETKYFSFVFCDDGINVFLEQHLINKYAPKYNRQYNEMSDRNKYDLSLFHKLYEPIYQKEMEKQLGAFSLLALDNEKNKQ